mgnify:CR=1 FL=1
MSVAWLIFDALLLGGILAVAWAAMAPGDAFRAIVMFMVMGLLVALAWVRLNAPDVALAEAAVGSGVTGALFLRTWNALPRDTAGDAAPAAAPGRALRLGALGLAAGVTGLLGAALATVGLPGPGLVGTVAANMPTSGVNNPVTAVLLNFRAYDTLLEVVVLLAAVVVVWSLAERAAPRPVPARGPVFLGFARLVLPATVVVAGYLLWLGAFAPGGAFQAGALLAAVAIVLLLGGLYRPATAERGRTRLAFGLGLAGFAGAGALTLGLEGAMLGYPPASAKTWILAIEALLTLSIAATLAGLFLGGRPAGRPAQPDPRTP